MKSTSIAGIQWMTNRLVPPSDHIKNSVMKLCSEDYQLTARRLPIYYLRIHSLALPCKHFCVYMDDGHCLKGRFDVYYHCTMSLIAWSVTHAPHPVGSAVMQTFSHTWLCPAHCLARPLAGTVVAASALLHLWVRVRARVRDRREPREYHDLSPAVLARADTTPCRTSV